MVIPVILPSYELDDLFERYRATPKGHVFAPLADACRKAGMLEEALEICKTHGGLIDLMLSDIVMPKMNGRELAES